MRILVVGKYRVTGRYLKLIEGLLPDDDLDFIGVGPQESDDFSAKAIKQYREDFKRKDLSSYDAVLGLGNEPLSVLTGHSGIMKYRGKDFVVHDKPCIVTISPGMIDHNPSHINLLEADIRALRRSVTGETVAGVLPPRIRVARTPESLQELDSDLANAVAVAFDLETTGFDEFEPDAAIVSLSLTTLHAGDDKRCWAIPLWHHASPFVNCWREVLKGVACGMRTVPIRIGHNAKFDCRWLVQFDAPVPANWDTMLAAHLINENRSKSLKNLARVELDAPEWDINIKGGRNAVPWYEQHKLRDILKYNGLDTWHTMSLYQLYAASLGEDQRLHSVFSKLIMPASQSLVHIERLGAYIDREKYLANRETARSTLDDIERRLRAYVPDDPPYEVNFNPSKFLRWLLFDYYELPILARGKPKDDGSPGEASCAEDVMSKLALEHPIAELLLERVKWQKYMSSFFNPYEELIDGNSRIHTTFKLAGTVTGRLSSGKADAEKVTGSRASALRGCNLQQVPRDPLVRGIFGAPPGWTFIEADYSQVELRIAAEIAQERNMLGLYARGEDIHMTMAMRMTGKPASEVTKEERKKAKAVNFGFLYGMGWFKFVETAWSNYGVVVTEQEAKAFRKAFFTEFPDLLAWHARQRRLAHKYKRVQTPLGRIRHLPDIDSRKESVVAEAERQAINSPVQGMASDLCLLSLVLLDRKFRKQGLRAHPIGTVHDAINFECPNDELPVVVPMIKQVMENPPTQQLFDYQIRVPIISDVAIGTHWGHKEEIPGDTVINPRKLERWLDEHIAT